MHPARCWRRRCCTTAMNRPSTRCCRSAWGWYASTLARPPCASWITSVPPERGSGSPRDWTATAAPCCPPRLPRPRDHASPTCGRGQSFAQVHADRLAGLRRLRCGIGEQQCLQPIHAIRLRRTPGSPPRPSTKAGKLRRDTPPRSVPGRTAAPDRWKSRAPWRQLHRRRGDACRRAAGRSHRAPRSVGRSRSWRDASWRSWQQPARRRRRSVATAVSTSPAAPIDASTRHDAPACTATGSSPSRKRAMSRSWIIMSRNSPPETRT